MIERMLSGQSAYGRAPAVRQDGPIAFGRSLFPILPEDRFDRGPLKLGHHTLVADVRLDNRAELTALLNLSASVAAQMCDAALLAECLLKWDAGALDRLVGEYAFGWWDAQRGELLLARDIMGHRPLFLHRGQGFLAFASMPSGLHALAEIPREFDSEFMAESLALLPRFDDRTHFAHIQRVQPGHLLRVTASRMDSRRYWIPPQPERTARNASHDYAEELRSVVDLAVAAQLRGADGVVCTHLSAGLDSGIVTSSAALQFAPDKVLAFTAAPPPGFDGPVPSGTIANEAPFAAAVAALYPNVEQIIVPSSGESPLAGLDRDYAFTQHPILNIENAVWSRAINRAAKERGAKVVLTGSFGNITVTYAGLEHLGALLRRGNVGGALMLARALRTSGMPWRSIGAQLVGHALPIPIWAAAAKLRGWVLDWQASTAVNPAEIPRINRVADSCGYDPTFRPMHDAYRYRYETLTEYDLGNYTKGALGEWGVSVRDPLLDRRVVECCFRTPVEQFVQGGVPRSLARRAFASRLPSEVVSGLARGYQAADWYVALDRDLPTLRDEIERIARCEPAAAALDVDWLRQVASAWPTDGWATQDVMTRYRGGLLRGVAAGHFMRKVAGTN